MRDFLVTISTPATIFVVCVAAAYLLYTVLTKIISKLDRIELLLEILREPKKTIKKIVKAPPVSE
jgi:hypothetical protein